MRFLLVFLVIILAGSFEIQAQRVDPCKIFGSFFKVDHPGRADIIVYEEDSEYFAQLRVFTEDNRLYADETGVWFFTDQIGFADYRVFFTKKRSQADFTIHFVNSLSRAGCK
jgi:hypothetical protein